MELGFWADIRDRTRLYDRLRQDSHLHDFEALFRKKDGQGVWVILSASSVEIAGDPSTLVVMRDVSAAKEAQEEIRSLAFYDQLTHLPNRRMLLDRLWQSIATNERTNRKGAVLFVDLDNFKLLNDTLGHKTGDLLLQQMAERLVASTRNSDTVARLGGDEFVVILENLSERAEETASIAKGVAEKIRTALEKPYTLSGRECVMTSSIGITVFGERHYSVDDVMQQADIAMYQAKSVGRNTVRFFAPALQEAVNARASMEEDLRQAIGTSQLQLYYQPQFGCGRMTGAEALLRWNHPTRGFVPPASFIPLAEETGLIIPLGQWILNTAFQQAADWGRRSETDHISVAVNISARQFRHPKFVEQVLSALHRTGANSQQIELELTESILVESVDDVVEKMTQLQSHGLKFSLDDFGTGYSSLSYLRQLPLDQLKIDRSFVRDMLVNSGSGAIAKAIISLCEAMGVNVIAEGVETEEQRTFLASLGCHSYQGYLFSPAVQTTEFERFFRSPELDRSTASF
jgi:diguanylate cyclase (GGDEF)-like protein